MHARAPVTIESEVDLGGFTVGVVETLPPGDQGRQAAHAGRPAILMLHAIGLDRHMWSQVSTELAAVARPIAIDLRGHGRAAGAPGAGTMKELAGDVVTVADRLGLHRFHLAGLSFGGAVAQEVALEVPDRLLSLSLVATVAKAFPAMRDRAEATRKEGMEPQIGATLARWFSPVALTANGAAVQYATACLRQADRDDWANAWETLATLDTLDRLPTLGRQPFRVNVIAGQLDLSATVPSMQDIARRIAGARFDVIDGAPHMIALERPSELALVLSRRLASGRDGLDGGEA